MGAMTKRVNKGLVHPKKVTQEKQEPKKTGQGATKKEPVSKSTKNNQS